MSLKALIISLAALTIISMVGSAVYAANEDIYAHLRCGPRLENESNNGALPDSLMEPFATYIDTGVLPTDHQTAMKILEIAIAARNVTAFKFPDWLWKRYLQSKYDDSLVLIPSEKAYFDQIDRAAEIGLPQEYLQSGPKNIPEMNVNARIALEVLQQITLPEWMSDIYWRAIY